MTQQRPFHIDLPITVKTYDVDFMGIVSNITYVRWLEDLRLCVLEAHYPLQKLLSELIVPVITQTHIEYTRPIRMHDRVNGSIWMEKFDSSGWLTTPEFLVNGKYAATAKQGGSIVNLGTMKPAIHRKVCKINLMRSRNDYSRGGMLVAVNFMEPLVHGFTGGDIPVPHLISTGTRSGEGETSGNR